jgi:sterol 3beta-glucosyltransferase
VRIGIQTWGSEGDIRPFIALGHALASRGHDVELLYTEVGERRYDEVARALGFTATPVASPVMTDAELQALGLKILATRDPFRQGLLIANHLFQPVEEPIYEAAAALVKRCDLLVYHFMVHPARAAADRAGTPAITVALAHMLIPSRHIHPQGTPRLGTWANAIEWKIARLALNLTLLKGVNRFRRKLGIAPFRDLMNEAWVSPLLHLIGASPALLDRPSDWPPQYQMCGFLGLPAHEHEPVSPDVERFLSQGPPPVFMGFGSLMPLGGTHLAESIRVLTDAARLSGRRAIIQADVAGSAGLSAVASAKADEIMFVKRTPHAQVFPRCAAVVHHAGAGTTHTTLRAGVPSIPVPHVSDQFAWSEELERLGVATRAVRRSTWTAEALADRIRQTAGNPEMKAAALDIQKRMANDDGPVTAAALIERAAQNL